jgi:orotidine-5'-phosphate decarboxylase
MNYLDKLWEATKKTGSIACMGLDPVLEAIPIEMHMPSNLTIPLFFENIFKEMEKQKVLPGAFKPNAGFYLRHDRPLESRFEGSLALASVMQMAKQIFPDIPLILDYKRGDIASSSANYAVEGFDCWGADAVTVAPYMGTDSVSPFAKYCNDEKGKGVYVLNRTSNPGAKDFQDSKVTVGLLSLAPLYEVVAHKISEWAKANPGVGAVVGATYPQELSDIANLYVKSGVGVPLLIPGVGKQGGSAQEVVARLREAGYPLEFARINSSSGLTHPWKTADKAPADYAKICVEQLAKLNEEIGYKAA